MASPVFSSGKEFQPNARFEQMNQPVSADQLQAQFDLPSATPEQTNRMTYEGVVSKTAIIAVGAFIAAVPGYLIPNVLAMYASALVAFVVSLVIIFRKKNSPALIAIYAVTEGYFLGALTTFIETRFEVPGAGLQALVATFATFAVVLALYRSGKVRYTSKMRRFLMISGLAYLVFSLFNLGYMIFGSSGSAWGLRTDVMVGPVPLGVVIGIAAVLIACVSLIADFDFIDNAVKNGAPKEIEWKAAFGLILTLVWLYIEFLRIIAILFGRR
ncbi:Bax inhibitor-1/YccA family protein [Demequina sp.]|uniref:Bax inhibitor-1/YccA family protein n=1 Tax=Demequina sp. TaxID=2050685 RepID=UPI003D0CFC12